MSIILTHRYIVRDIHAVPFLTKYGIGFHFYPRNSVLLVHQKVHKRSCSPQKFPLKPSKPSPCKPEVQEKPVQSPTTIKTVPSQNQERELFAGSVTLGSAPSPRHVPIPMFCR
ncbi:hypothetical protein V5N11_009206 [Cardamine amara subsp. amara]|uniref:Uncharacterized protein n=1 Tax=Cardamine amara subsp. amara TaxID=228776 RepID=A0ABD1AJ48_CARAN